MKIKELEKTLHRSDGNNYPVEELPDITGNFVEWLNLSALKNPDGSYVVPDHSGTILIMGKRRSGKTALMYGIANHLHKIDPDRIVVCYKTPPQVVPYLQKQGLKAVDCDDILKIPYNCIVLIDEGILNTNAKLALTKWARNFDMIMAILSHKRAIMMVTFQRWEIFASFEMAECCIYKQLGAKIINRTDDKFILRYKEIINKLEKSKALMEIELDGYKGPPLGFINIALPKWYSKELSESYANKDIDFALDDLNKKLELQNQIAIELLNAKIIPNPTDKSLYHSIRSKIRRTYRIHKFNNSEIDAIIERQYEILRFETGLLSLNPEEVDELGELAESAKLDDISKTDLETFKLFCLNKSMNSFETNKTNVRRMINKVGLFLYMNYMTKSLADKQGNKYERLLVNYYMEQGDYVMRAMGSGGFRGGSKFPAPDCIHFKKNGEIRIVQIKSRMLLSETFNPGSFTAEIETVKMLDQTELKGKVKPYLYFMAKGHPIESVFEIPILEEYDKKTLYVDFTNRFYEIREYVPKHIPTMEEEIKRIEENLKEVENMPNESCNPETFDEKPAQIIVKTNPIEDSDDEDEDEEDEFEGEEENPKPIEINLEEINNSEDAIKDIQEPENDSLISNLDKNENKPKIPQKIKVSEEPKIIRGPNPRIKR